MLLADYVKREGNGAITRLQRKTRLAYTTVFRALHHAVGYRSAKKLSEATGGEVSILELCEPNAPVRPKTGTEDA
jgi:hypothetical protein